MADKAGNVALLGHGRFGRNHARVLHQLGALGMICDPFQQALDGAASFAQEGVELALDFHRALRNPDIDAVVIATPAKTHFDAARSALLAGKHVFVEKPITLDVTHGQQLVQIAAQRNLTLMVGHLLMYHPAIVTMHAWIMEGRLGRVFKLGSSRRNLGTIRVDENSLWSFAPHDLAVFGMLLGELPERVNCIGQSVLHPGVQDWTNSTLFYPSGTAAEISVSWLHYQRLHYIHVTGENGVLEFVDNRAESTLTFYPLTIRNHEEAPTAKRGDGQVIDFDRTEALQLEDQTFLRCIATGEQPISDGQNGVAVLRQLAALQQSLDANGGQVTLQ